MSAGMAATEASDVRLKRLVMKEARRLLVLSKMMMQRRQSRRSDAAKEV